MCIYLINSYYESKSLCLFTQKNGFDAQLYDFSWTNCHFNIVFGTSIHIIYLWYIFKEPINNEYWGHTVFIFEQKNNKSYLGSQVLLHLMRRRGDAVLRWEMDFYSKISDSLPVKWRFFFIPFPFITSESYKTFINLGNIRTIVLFGTHVKLKWSIILL
jgi:hypothetical protein